MSVMAGSNGAGDHGAGSGAAAAARALFYHLTRRPAEDTLPALIDRALAAGSRVVLRGTDRARLERIDERLWLEPEDGFLPHGIEGGPHDADQPVLLATGPGRPNGADCLILIDGAGPEAGELAALNRICVLFDGNDAAAVTAARALWRDLATRGLSPEYWSEDSGRWQRRQ